MNFNTKGPNLLDMERPAGKRVIAVFSDEQDAREVLHMLERCPTTKAAEDAIAERERQKKAEGWTEQHDDEHRSMELARAAGCYALGATPSDGIAIITRLWPWDRKWWKPATHRRNCVKAAALLLAEIERIDRAFE